MITPGYGLTATERVLPRMALDFTTASLDSRVTVTRALNTATRFNSSGYLEIVNANLPRFDFNPSTLVCRGLLIEETRANLLVRSNAFTTSPWQTSGTVTAAQNITGPDNVANSAWTLTDNDAANTAYFYRAIVVANDSTAYSISAFIQKTSNATTFPALGLNILGGSVGVLAAYVLNTNTGVATAASTNATASSAVVQDAGLFWRLCISTANNSTGNTVAYYSMYPAVNTTGGSVFVASTTGSAVFYGAQLEAGAFATSYIPTTTTSLTRNADAVTMTGTNFSSWYSSSSAALAAVVIPSIATGTRPIWQLDDTTANEIIALRGNVANPELYIVDNGTPQAQLDAGTITANTQYGLCAAFTANSCAASQNGATPVTTATATMPTVTQARIGSDGSNFLNGVVRTLRYWPQRILNAETQAFSK